MTVTPYSMNIGEMIEEVRDQIRDTKKDTQILRWLNMTSLQLASRFQIPGFSSIGNFPTVVSTQIYSLAVDFHWLKRAWIPSATGGIRTLYPVDEKLLISMAPDWNTITGTVTNYLLDGLNLSLWKIPASIQTIYYSYIRRPKVLLISNLTDVSDFPADFHPIIVQGALVRGFKMEKNEQFSSAFAEYKDMLNEIKKTIYVRPDMEARLGEPFRISGPPRITIPQPTHLPGTYNG
jgi:hypothetical protein